MKSISLKMDSMCSVSSWKFLSKIFTKRYSRNWKYWRQKPNKHPITTCLSTFLSSLTRKYWTRLESKKLRIRMLIIWKTLPLPCLSCGVVEFVSSDNFSHYSSYFLRFILIKRNSFKFHWNMSPIYQKKTFPSSGPTIAKMYIKKTPNCCPFWKKYPWMTLTQNSMPFITKFFIISILNFRPTKKSLKCSLWSMEIQVLKDFCSLFKRLSKNGIIPLTLTTQSNTLKLSFLSRKTFLKHKFLSLWDFLLTYASCKAKISINNSKNW